MDTRDKPENDRDLMMDIRGKPENDNKRRMCFKPEDDGKSGADITTSEYDNQWSPFVNLVIYLRTE